jgi:uracil-DNA glycosylase
MAERSSESLRRGVRQALESLEAAGVRQLPKGKGRKGDAKPQADSLPETGSPEVGTTTPFADSGRATQDSGRGAHVAAERTKGGLFAAEDQDAAVTSRAATLEILAQEVAGCTLCGELALARTQTVFGVGNPKARLVFLGEAPGADEDRLGEPFVGRAGQLLNKILEACKLRREDVYILNILKCRPPGNRNPLPNEAANCRRYLDRQLELIGPEFICCLGSVAAQNLLSTTESIGRMRGRLLDYRGAKVVCTYHPAYLLRNPAAKKDAWDDMKFLMREMGTPVA